MKGVAKDDGICVMEDKLFWEDLMVMSFIVIHILVQTFTLPINNISLVSHLWQFLYYKSIMDCLHSSPSALALHDSWFFPKLKMIMIGFDLIQNTESAMTVQLMK